MTLTPAILEQLRRENRPLYEALLSMQQEIDVLRSNLRLGDVKSILDDEGRSLDGLQVVPFLKVLPAAIVKALHWPDGTILRSGETQGCRVFHSANQATVTGVGLVVAFDSERFDTYAMHDVTTNNSRITFHRDGAYIVGCSIRFSADDAGVRDVVIRKNGSVVIARHNTPDIGAVVAAIHINIETCYEFKKDDYVEVVATQTSGANVIVIQAVAEEGPEFWAHAIGLR